MLGALEHQVLEQVREAGAPWPLMARADQIEHLDRDDRQGVIFTQKYGEPIVELILLDR
jgi:hypothetical protein